MRSTLKIVGIIAFGAYASASIAQSVGDTYQNGSLVRIGQYSTQASTPAQTEIEPLDVFVLLNYPKQTVFTVGDAINYTLTRSGWRLVDPAQMQPEAARFLSLPLPESQRQLGTYRVRDVLETLAGGATWKWQFDYVTRTLWFQLSNPALSASQLPEKQAINAAVPAQSVPVIQRTAIPESFGILDITQGFQQ